MRRDTLKTIVISAAILGMLSLGSWAAASPDKALEASEEIDPYAWQAVEPLARNTIERESASRSIAGVLLTTPDPTLSGAPGTQVTYPVTLENQTASDEVFTLDYTGNTWTATGPADTGLVADGGTFVFDVLVTIPAGLDDCMVDTVQITATSVSTPADNATLDLFTETAATVLFDNGPFMNSPGTGVGGADESVLQNTSLGMTTIGFGHQVTSDNRIADDFTVTDAAGWQVDRIVFYAYQTNAPNVSTITAVNYQIWDGPPTIPAPASSSAIRLRTAWRPPSGPACIA